MLHGLLWLPLLLIFVLLTALGWLERRRQNLFRNWANGSEICKSKLFTLIERIQNVKVNERQIQPFLQEILIKLEFLDREQLIKLFISTEFNRYLTYYEGAKDINSSTTSIDKKKGLNRKKFQRKKNFRKFSGKKYSKKKFKK